MLGKSRSLFIKDYNDRLSNWLVIFSLTVAMVGRFIIKFFLLEIAGWAMFIFLETYTRMFWSSESMYYNPSWHVIVSTWETIVYSPFLDLDRQDFLNSFLILFQLSVHQTFFTELFSIIFLLLEQMGNSNWYIAVGPAPVLAVLW